jgi:hypothetical protein
VILGAVTLQPEQAPLAEITEGLRAWEQAMTALSSAPRPR